MINLFENHFPLDISLKPRVSLFKVDECRGPIQPHPAHPEKLGRLLFRRLLVRARRGGRPEDASRTGRQRPSQLAVAQSRRAPAQPLRVRPVQSRSGALQDARPQLPRRTGAGPVADIGAGDAAPAGVAHQPDTVVPREPPEFRHNTTPCLAHAEHQHQAHHHARHG